MDKLLDNQIDSSARLVSVAERLLSLELKEKFLVNNIDLTAEQWRIMFYLWIEDGVVYFGSNRATYSGVSVPVIPVLTVPL